jgi:hypothetical protein
MPLEFIPNQPIIFEHPIGDYPCLNNDPKSYGQLLQDGDELCIQWKLSPCNEPMCEPDMVMDPVGTDELGAWTVGGGWSTTGSADIAFDGTGNPGGLCDQTLAGLTTGVAYVLDLNVATYTGTVTYEVIVDLQTVYIIDRLGSHKIGFTATSASFGLAFNPVGTSTAGDQLAIDTMTLKQYTTCWEDDLNGGLSSWSYSFDGANGKFCSLDPTGGDLINTNAISAPGNYHGVKLTITDCTQGGITVTLGSTLMGSQTSGNGQFTFYGVPTAGVDMVISKADNFDGCISQVTVNDYGDIDSYEVHFETDDGNTFSDDYSVVAFEDRIVWCDLLSNLTWTVDGLPDGALTCKLLKTFIYDPCDATEYESVNYINYKNDGWECTKLVEAWSDGYAFGFYFGDINNPDFKLRQRLRFLAFNPVYRNAGEEYLYSSGATGRSFAQSQKARTAWFDYMDEYAHDCTRTQLLNQKLFIDNYAFYYPTEDYEPEWNERGAYNLAQSRVTVFHEEAIFGTTCGTMANAVCPPQIVPVPTPAELNEVIVLVDTLNISPIDQFSVLFTDYYWGTTGVPSQGPGGGPYDLTDGIQRAAFATQIANVINITFGTTTTSTSCTIAGTNLNLTVICSGTVSIPMQGFSIAIYSAGQIAKPLPITFA